MIEIRRGTEHANYRATQHPDCTVVITKDALERISAAGLCAFGLAGLVGTLCLTIDLVGPLVTLLPFSIVVGWIGAVGFFNRTEIHRHRDAWVVWNGPIPNPLEKQRRRFPRVPEERVFSEVRQSNSTTKDGRQQSNPSAVVVLDSPAQPERILFSMARLEDATRIAEALQEGLPSPEESAEVTASEHPAFSILHRTREALNVAVAPQKRFVGFISCLFSVPWLLVGMHLPRIGVSDGRTLAGCVFLVVMGLILLAAGSRMVFERTIVQMTSTKWTVTQSHSFGERTHLRRGTQRFVVRKNNLRVRTGGRAPVTVLSGQGYLLEVVSGEPSEPAFPIVVMNHKADAEALAECLRLG